MAKKEEKKIEATRSEAVAITKNIRITPRKMRLVIDLVRNKPLQEAYNILLNTNKSASEVVLKTIKSAEANAVNNFHMNPSDLIVSKIFAGDGPRLKRFLPRAKGSASGIIKRTSMLTVVVSQKGVR